MKIAHRGSDFQVEKRWDKTWLLLYDWYYHYYSILFLFLFILLTGRKTSETLYYSQAITPIFFRICKDTVVQWWILGEANEAVALGPFFWGPPRK